MKDGDDFGRLCLTMKSGDFFTIDENIKVEIVTTKELRGGSRIRIVITAPKAVRVKRYDRESEKKES